MSEVRFCVRTMSEKSPGASQILNASSILQEVRMDGPYSTAQLRAPNFGDPAQRHLGCFTSGLAAMWKCI